MDLMENVKNGNTNVVEYKWLHYQCKQISLSKL